VDIHYGNSSDEQKRFIEAKIDQEVLALQISLVEEKLLTEALEAGEIENLYVPRCPKCGEAAELEHGDWVPGCSCFKLDTSTWDADDEGNKECPHCGDYLDDEGAPTCDCFEPDTSQWDDEPQEVFQWFLVTSWLADRLEAIGEPVLRNDYGDWWGRTCCGQRIALDPTFWVIFQEGVQQR